MEKKDLINSIDSILKPLGFKRKGNYWKLETDELIKILNIQKSSFSNLYYIYFGFNVKGIKDETFNIQVFLGLGSEDETENKYIQDLLNFELNMDENERKMGINKAINEKIITILNSVNTEHDLKQAILKNEMKKNLLPGVVMKYFGLSYL